MSALRISLPTAQKDSKLLLGAHQHSSLMIMPEITDTTTVANIITNVITAQATSITEVGGANLVATAKPKVSIKPITNIPTAINQFIFILKLRYC